MVSEDVAKRRAKICMGCPHNVFPDKGAFIEWADSMAEAATGGKRIEETDKLGNCEVCSCPLRAKIWHKGPFKLLKQEKQKLPGFCWQLKHRKTNA